jgi:sugar/nucleoside kinase (ribokinase family)
MKAIVFGNVTLDVICKTVDDVPRHESITFDQVAVTPGGCGSNVAVGLSALDVDTALVACLGSDDAANLDEAAWRSLGIDLRYLRHVKELPTGTSIGLVDSDSQPRFIHTSGANALLTVDDLDLRALLTEGAQILHIAGFFVLPGLMDGRLPEVLAQARHLGLITSLDVVTSPRMDDPSTLWPCLPHLDIFFCNEHEAWRLTGESDPKTAARILQERGGNTVIVKLGAKGCWLEVSPSHQNGLSGRILASKVPVVDTTGAGDAFASGFIAALLQGHPLQEACIAGNKAGARIVSALGAIGGWQIK